MWRGEESSANVEKFLFIQASYKRKFSKKQIDLENISVSSVINYPKYTSAESLIKFILYYKRSLVEWIDGAMNSWPFSGSTPSGKSANKIESHLRQQRVKCNCSIY